MRPQNEECRYPLDPFDQLERIHQEQASIAYCIGQDYRADPQADLTYWHKRAALLTGWVDQLRPIIKAQGDRAREYLASKPAYGAGATTPVV
jgi:hypothetical protein